MPVNYLTVLGRIQLVKTFSIKLGKTRNFKFARYAWMSDERIRLKLKAGGYARTVTAIH